jgi:hypothetical protein
MGVRIMIASANIRYANGGGHQQRDPIQGWGYQARQQCAQCLQGWMSSIQDTDTP